MTAYESTVSLKSGDDSEKPEEWEWGHEGEGGVSIKMIKSEADDENREKMEQKDTEEKKKVEGYIA